MIDLKEFNVARNMYPHMKENVILHASPSYGLILYGYPPKPLYISSDTLEILVNCNGMKTFDEILTSLINSNKRGDDFAICKAIIIIGRLINEGIIILNKKSKKYELQITGSSTVFYPTSMQIELTIKCAKQCLQ